MPDAWVENDGEFRLGISHLDPYAALWSSVTILPRLEVSARYTTIENIPVFASGANIGDFRDKAFDAKLILFHERGYLPQFAVGTQDFLGTRLFSADYVALGKRFGGVDVAVGAGRDRIDGAFGGLRYRPDWGRGLGLVAEYDAFDYARDYAADESGAAHRAGGMSYAAEYHYGWLGGQVSYQDGDIGANLYVVVPLMEREFIPKIAEPAPVAVTPSPASIEEWRDDRKQAAALERALRREGFERLHVYTQGRTLAASLSHPRISSVTRAVGRAARVLAGGAPRDADAVRITYTVNDLPAVTYTFHDLPLLRRFLAGEASWAELEASAEVAPDGWADPRQDGQVAVSATASAAGAQASDVVTLIGPGDARDNKPVLDLNPFNLLFLFNITRSVPGRAFHYDVFSLLSYRKRVDEGLYLLASGRLKLYEDISDIAISSDSLLPHVRSDIAEYKQGGYLRLDSLLANKYFAVRERLLGRVSVGYYEEMYAGVGGQLLYLSGAGDWAMDLMLDRVRQREPGDNFAFRDYAVTTGLMSGHYYWPAYGMTATARAGRFLAGDDGIRYELKRRFHSGVEVGAWYTLTDGHDITGPGSPGAPYRDKGVFVAIPLSSMLTADTRQSARIALSPWSRDVGQMVTPPDDLYQSLEQAAVRGVRDGLAAPEFLR